MSGELVDRAWRVDGLKPSEKLTLLYAADIAREEHQFRMWSSIATIATATGLHRDTVQEALATLCRKRHLTRTLKPGATTWYQVHPTPGEIAPRGEIHPGVNHPRGRGEIAPGGKGKFTPGPGGKSPALTIIEPSNKPSRKPAERAKARSTAAKINSGWKPSGLSDHMSAKISHWSADRAEHELAKFINHHASRGTTSRDWNAQWRTWILNGLQYEERRNGSQSRSPGHETTGDVPSSNPFVRAVAGRRAARGS